MSYSHSFPWRLRLFATLTAGILSFSFPATAQETDVGKGPDVIWTAESDASPKGHDDGRRTLGKFPVNLVRGAGGVFARDSLQPLLIGAVVVGTSTLLDDEVRDWIADEDDEYAEFADSYLGPAVLGVVTLGFFVGGRYSEDSRFRAMTYDLGVATVVNLGYTAVLKAAVSRERPNESNDESFPSGHTSNAFALASVAQAHYGKKVGIPAYMVASLVGISRLRSNAHWLSDVVAGAALGHIVGRAVVRQNDKPLDSKGKQKKKVTFAPVLTAEYQGMTVEIVF